MAIIIAIIMAINGNDNGHTGTWVIAIMAIIYGNYGHNGNNTWPINGNK